MTYEMAEHKYHCSLRDRGYIGELPYASRETSIQTTEGDWILKDQYGDKLAVVTKNGRII
jgi:hypothetical protein